MPEPRVADGSSCRVPAAAQCLYQQNPLERKRDNFLFFFFCLIFTPGSYLSVLKGLIDFWGSSSGFAAWKFVGCS